MGKFVLITLVYIFIGRVRVIKKTSYTTYFSFFTNVVRPLRFTSRLIENENESLFPLVTIALAFGSTARKGFTPLYRLYSEVRPAFSAVLVRKRVSILISLVSNRVRIFNCNRELGMFCRRRLSHFFIIIYKTIIEDLYKLYLRQLCQPQRS